ncbi:prolipoprotein diacylglyceryl transferase [bacterium]|nr:prolipoprotein diacylglyceryl transferase [bacterium]
MFPDLLHIGPFQIHAYGFMMTLAFIAAILISVYRAKKVGLDPGLIWDVSLVIMLSSLVGSRLTYVFTHIDEFRHNWFSIINPIQADGRIGIAGMVLLGGVVLASISTAVFVRRRKLSFWVFSDIIAPALALGIGIGRLGCLANGCCYGAPTDVWCGIVFPEDSVAGSYFPHTHLWPTQIFSVLWGLTLFAGLWFAERWKSFDGYTFSLFLIFYSIFRILIDTIRVYEESDILIHTDTIRITFSQGVSGILLLVGVYFFVRLRKAKYS